MPKKQLRILIKNIKEIIKEYPQLKSTISEIPLDLKELFNIDENYIDLNNLEPLLDILKLNYEKSKFTLDTDKSVTKLIQEILDVTDYDIRQKLNKNYDTNEINKEIHHSIFNFCNNKSKNKIEKTYNRDCKSFLLLFKGWNELHYTYLSTICDYISQMTDDYAIKEYHELYLN